MTITYIEGWDYGSAVRIAGVVGAPAVVTSPTWRNHGYAMRITAAAGKCAAEMYCSVSASGLALSGSDGSKWCASFAFYPDALPNANIPFAYECGAGTQAYFWIKTTGELGISYGSGGAVTWGAVALSADTWYIISLSDAADAVAGTMQIKLYNAGGALLETISLNRGGAIGTARWAIGNNQTNATFDFEYDAMFIEHGYTGDPFANLGYGGYYDLMVLTPTAQGDTGGTTGGTYADVDEIPCDGSTTKETAQNGAAYRNEKTWTGWTAPVTIAGIQGLCRVTGNSGTRPRAHLTYKSGATAADGAQFTVYLSADYSVAETYRGKLFLLDPATAAAWAQAAVEAFQCGVYEEDGGAVACEWSQDLLQVLYRMPGGGSSPMWWF